MCSSANNVEATRTSSRIRTYGAVVVCKPLLFSLQHHISHEKNLRDEPSDRHLEYGCAKILLQ